MHPVESNGMLANFRLHSGGEAWT